MAPPERHGPDSRSPWEEWRIHVLAELKRINQTLERMSGDMTQVKIDVAMLQVKSGVWGGLAGLVVAVSIILLKQI